MEKYWIIKHFDDPNLSNKKLERISQCRHQNKVVLINVKTTYLYRYV